MTKFQIVSKGIPVGTFSERQDAVKALKYVESGMIEEVLE